MVIVLKIISYQKATSRMTPSSIVQSIIATITRFPLSALCSLMCSALVCSALLIGRIPYKISLIGILCIGFSWFISLTLHVENAKSRTKPSSRWHFAGGSVLFLVLAIYLYKSPPSFQVFFALNLAAFLSILIAPFVGQSATTAHIKWFQYNIWKQLVLTIFTAGLLYLIALLTSFSLNFLFESNANWVLLITNLILTPGCPLITTLVCPFLGMSGIPNRFDVKPKAYPELLRRMLQYIAVPFFFIYSIILYIYVGKILIAGSLPKGHVADIVCAFGTFGLGTYIFSYPFHDMATIFTLFRKHFFKILSIPLLLLAVGIATRVSEFGITGSRYLVLMFLIWFTLCTGFSFLKKEGQENKLIFLSLIALIVLSSVGPLQMEKVCEWSQIHRLKTLLIKNQMLVEGKIHKSTAKLNTKDADNIQSIVKYLVRTEKVKSLEELFPNTLEDPKDPKKTPLTVKKILHELGITPAKKGSDPYKP